MRRFFPVLLISAFLLSAVEIQAQQTSDPSGVSNPAPSGQKHQKKHHKQKHHKKHKKDSSVQG
jgi:hypothetical protein